MESDSVFLRIKDLHINFRHVRLICTFLSAISELQISNMRNVWAVENAKLIEDVSEKNKLHPTIYEQAGSYFYHLAMNHPFVDGNKRTAFAVMDTFLRVNGYELTLPNDEAYDLVMAVVNQQVSKPGLIEVLQTAVKASGGGDR